MKLKNGTVQALFYGQRANPLYSSPILQITSLNMFKTGASEKNRYKANLSDGTNYMKAVFSNDVSEKLDNGEIRKFTIIRIGDFHVKSSETNNYLYVISIAEYESCEEEIGHAVNISSGKQSLEVSGVCRNENEYQKETAMPIKRQESTVMPYVEAPKEQSKKQKSCEDDVTEIKRIFPHKKTLKFKGRVVSKTDIKRFNTERGEGKVFSFEVADSSGQIKCVAFTDAVDTFFPLIEINKTYMFSNFNVRPANKKFSTHTSDFEVLLEKNSEIIHICDDDIPKYVFKFVKIAEMITTGMFVDCIGVIKEIYPPAKIVVKSTGKELSKRDMLIVDPTGSCRLTLWGQRAEEEFEKDTILCVKSARVGEYNGITLSTVSSSQVMANIDIPEAVSILAWYHEEGAKMIVEKPKKAPRRSFISEVKEQSIEYSTIQASLLYMKEDGLFYEACPSESCNKKVSMEDNGIYRCERCNYTFDKCNYRYMINVHVADFTGQMWVTLFDECGKVLFGMSAGELKMLGESDPEKAHNLIKERLSKEFQFRIKCKEENYNGETKVRTNCMELCNIDYAFEMKRMLDAIEKVAN